MLPIRVVQEQPWSRDRPVREDLDQPPLRQKLSHAISFEVIGNAEPVERSRHADVSMVGDDGAVHRYFETLPPFFKFPAIVPAVHLEPPVDACVLMQIGGGLRSASTSKVRWRRHGNHVQVWREADGNHVLLKPSTRADAGVKAANDDIGQRVIDHDVEHHVRICLMKAGKPGRNDGPRCDAQRVDTQRANGLSCGFAGFGDCYSHFSKQRGYTLIEKLATCRWCDASCCAIQEACANPAFKLSNGLAECRRRQAQMLCRPGKARPFNHGSEGS